MMTFTGPGGGAALFEACSLSARIPSASSRTLLTTLGSAFTPSRNLISLSSSARSAAIPALARGSAAKIEESSGRTSESARDGVVCIRTEAFVERPSLVLRTPLPRDISLMYDGNLIVPPPGRSPMRADARPKDMRSDA